MISKAKQKTKQNLANRCSYLDRAWFTKLKSSQASIVNLKCDCRNAKSETIDWLNTLLSSGVYTVLSVSNFTFGYTENQIIWKSLQDWLRPVPIIWSWVWFSWFGFKKGLGLSAETRAPKRHLLLPLNYVFPKIHEALHLFGALVLVILTTLFWRLDWACLEMNNKTDIHVLSSVPYF